MPCLSLKRAVALFDLADDEHVLNDVEQFAIAERFVQICGESLLQQVALLGVVIGARREHDDRRVTERRVNALLQLLEDFFPANVRHHIIEQD